MNIFTQFAQKITPGTGDGQVSIPTFEGYTVLDNLLNVIYFAAAATAVIVIILAAITLASSGDDAGKVKSARNRILFSVIGLVIVLAAFAINNFVIGSF